MSELKKILVGIDPRQSRRGNFLPPVAEAVEQAIRLAELTAAEITFLSAVDPPEHDEFVALLDDEAQIAPEPEADCQKPLNRLVEQAKKRGARATSKIAYGTGWIELSREATNGHHDLVIVGTRNQGIFRRALFGSTAMKLLHNCPVPVWVAKPVPHPTPARMLVASDFSQVSDKALRLAADIGSSSRASVHLIHAVKQPYARLSDTGEAETRREDWLHERHIAAARHRLERQLRRVLGKVDARDITIAEDIAVADHAIAKYVESHGIDLLVMGTSSRGGLEGVFVGNTAERLLTTVSCSLLVVKPDGFECPVCLDMQPSEPAAVAASANH
jgi:universal stress protein E